MHDEGVHLPCLCWEPRDSIPALLGGSEFKLEEGIVLCANDAEVVGHCGRQGPLTATSKDNELESKSTSP